MTFNLLLFITPSEVNFFQGLGKTYLKAKKRGVTFAAIKRHFSLMKMQSFSWAYQ